MGVVEMGEWGVVRATYVRFGGSGSSCGRWDVVTDSEARSRTGTRKQISRKVVVVFTVVSKLARYK